MTQVQSQEQEWIESVPCPLCEAGPAELAPLLEGRDLLHPDTGPAGLRFTASRCRHCGFVFLSRRVREDRIGTFYPSNYISHAAPESQTSAKARSALSTAVANLRELSFYRAGPLRPLLAAFTRTRPFKRAPLSFEGRGRRLLDVGCGTGRFLAYQKSWGWDVTGIELSPGAAAQCRAHGLNVLTGTIFDERLEKGSFDVLTMNQVLEHVYNPRDTLRRAFELLRPGGFLYLNLPDFQSASRRWFGSHWYPLDMPRHVLYFTPATLRKCLAQAGFEVRQTFHLSSVKSITRSVQYRLEENGSAGFWAAVVKSPRAVTALVRVTDALGLGDNLFAIARKP